MPKRNPESRTCAEIIVLSAAIVIVVVYLARVLS